MLLSSSVETWNSQERESTDTCKLMQDTCTLDSWHTCTCKLMLQKLELNQVLWVATVKLVSYTKHYTYTAEARTDYTYQEREGTRKASTCTSIHTKLIEINICYSVYINKQTNKPISVDRSGRDKHTHSLPTPSQSLPTQDTTERERQRQKAIFILKS